MRAVKEREEVVVVVEDKKVEINDDSVLRLAGPGPLLILFILGTGEDFSRLGRLTKGKVQKVDE